MASSCTSVRPVTGLTRDDTDVVGGRENASPDLGVLAYDVSDELVNVRLLVLRELDREPSPTDEFNVDCSDEIELLYKLPLSVLPV